MLEIHDGVTTAGTRFSDGAEPEIMPPPSELPVEVPAEVPPLPPERSPDAIPEIPAPPDELPPSSEPEITQLCTSTSQRVALLHSRDRSRARQRFHFLLIHVSTGPD